MDTLFQKQKATMMEKIKKLEDEKKASKLPSLKENRNLVLKR
jgi:hypothetical protein